MFGEKTVCDHLEVRIAQGIPSPSRTPPLYEIRTHSIRRRLRSDAADIGKREGSNGAEVPFSFRDAAMGLGSVRWRHGGTCCAQVTSSRRGRLRRLRVSHRMSEESELSERFFIVSTRVKGGVSSLIHASNLWTIQKDQCGESTRFLACKIIDLDAARFNEKEAVHEIHLITMAARQCAASEVGHSRDRPKREAQIRHRVRHLVGRCPAPRALRRYPIPTSAFAGTDSLSVDCKKAVLRRAVDPRAHLCSLRLAGASPRDRPWKQTRLLLLKRVLSVDPLERTAAAVWITTFFAAQAPLR